MIRKADDVQVSTQRLGLFDNTPQALRALLEKWNEPAYRAEQIFRWIYQEGVESYEQMSNLPKALRTRLAAELPIYQSFIANRQESSDGTIKLLLRWPDGATTECVLIPDADRRTACISTQVGCPVACVFCASGLEGLERNLSAGQIVEQAMRVRQLCEGFPSRALEEPDAPIPYSARLSNIVFMGLGEPLSNYDATVHALRTINAEWGMGIGARKITVSTVGLPKQMRQLADEKLQITLALSLHAPNDALRQELIPWARGVTIDMLVDAANYYFDTTGREITLEYILLGGLNDRLEHAAELARVSKRMRSNINLIAYNPVAGLPYRRPEPDDIRAFVAALRDQGVNAHVRRSRGLDIDSACGQLRRRVRAHSAGLR